MQTLVSAEEMRWCDATTIRKFGVPGLVLMEHAGRGVADDARRIIGLPTNSSVLIFCGKGNNGGDGLVAARHLYNAGYRVTVVFLNSPRQFSGDALTNFKMLDKLRSGARESLVFKSYSRSVLGRLPNPSIIIDAIFGTGFSGEVQRPARDVIDWINKQDVPVLAVDIPSGVDGTTGQAGHCAVRASHTATFGLLKTSLLCHDGQDRAGHVHLIDIGFPKSVSASASFKTFRVEEEDVRRALPQRTSTSNKYSVGKIFVLAGSRGFTGAAYLCSLAALRSGAGAVMLGTPESVYPILARRLTEAIVRPLPSTADGSIALGAYEEIREKSGWADCIVLGPGLSTNAETLQLVRMLIEKHAGKFVIDADALRVIGEIGLSGLARMKRQMILTPHSGEYGRIIGQTSKMIDLKRIEMARKGGLLGKTTVVLKGGPTATGTKKGIVYLNSTGNPGMATVGSGDVLTGIIAALWAQGTGEEEAAYSGVFLHGLAGDLAAEAYGQRSIIAQDLIDHLPGALRRIEQR